MRVVFKEKDNCRGKIPMAISAQTLASSREYFFFLITVTRVPRLNQDAKRQVFPKYHKGKILLINELQPWAMLDYSNSMHTLSAFKLTCLYEENDIYQIWRARVNKINKMLLEPPHGRASQEHSQS